MAAHQLSAVTATRGIALKASRVAVKKARVGTRVQAVRPREPENLVFIPHGSSVTCREPFRHPSPDHDPPAIRHRRPRLPRRRSHRSPPPSKSTSRCVPLPVRGVPLVSRFGRPSKRQTHTFRERP